MTTRITATEMTSDRTSHRCFLVPGEGWACTWLPTGRRLTQDQAVTAMTIAEVATKDDLTRMWPFLRNWAAELGLETQDAVTRASQPPADGHERAEHQQGGERS